MKSLHPYRKQSAKEPPFPNKKNLGRKNQPGDVYKRQVQLVDRNFVKVHHVSDYMIRALLLFKQESATRDTMFQGDRSCLLYTSIVMEARFSVIKEKISA